MMSLYDDYKSLVEMNKQMDSQLDIYRDLMDSTILHVYGLSLAVKDALTKYTMKQIEALTDDQINEILLRGFEDQAENTNIINMQNGHQSNDDYKDKSFSEYAIYIFKQIKDSLNEAESMEEKKKQIGKEIEDFSNSYFDYVNSPEYKERKLEQIRNLRRKAESTTNLYEKRKITDMLNTLEKAETLEFLMDQIALKGDKEVNNIVDIFFNPTRSTIVMEKFKSKIPKFGYNPDIYKRFFNLEETFLPEKYHIFNNLFLFHVMRTISFLSPDNKNDGLYVSSIFINIYNLIYHKFGTTEQEEEFVTFIKAFEDMFFDKWTDKFTKDNISHPNHPERMRKDAELDQKHRMMIIAQLQNRGIEPDTSLSTIDLRRMLDDALEKEQEAEDNTEPVEKNEYSSVDVTPITPSEVPEPTPEEPEEEDESVEQITANGNETVPVEESEPEGEIIKVEKEVYVDRFRYYYVRNEDGTYTYYTRENTVHEENIPELTVLQLVNAGSLTKETRVFPAD